MNRLNRIIDVLNEVIAEYMYVMMWTEDEGERKKGIEGIERLVKVELDVQSVLKKSLG